MLLRTNDLEILNSLIYSYEEFIDYHEFKDLLVDLKEEVILLSNNAVRPEVIFLNFKED